MSAVANLPHYLKEYCSQQNYEAYTSEQHAAWRYIMRQCRDFFQEHAVSDYLEGLKKTGIPIDRIPRISEMDAALADFGWGAVPVCGFIPPAAFLDFQSRKVLPIATDMRSVGHIAYTPAPDIVHEAAGHAPIIAYPEYAEYLCRYANLARKAIMSHEDVSLYQAIRHLSDTKENPDSTPDEVNKREQDLVHATESLSYVSEAAKVARMNWWTVEYGLAGALEKPKIYGAGLLSSVGESQNCLSDRVKKIPFSIDCINFSYNITEPQPQLFVTPSLVRLCEVLTELENLLSFKIGGAESLARAKRAKTITTVKLNSKVAVSGILTEYENDKARVDYIRFAGPVQISLNELELPDQGKKRHPEGFSSPIGRWEAFPDRDPSTLTPSELSGIGLEEGKRTALDFSSGFSVNGRISRLVRDKDRLILVTWTDCSVTRGEKNYFEPEWGEFDMLVGENVRSVYGGPADRKAYGNFEVGLAETSPSRKSDFTPQEKDRFEIYTKIRTVRAAKTCEKQEIQHLISKVMADFPQQWLLHLELYELAVSFFPEAPEWQELAKKLSRFPNVNETDQWLSAQGLKLAPTPD